MGLTKFVSKISGGADEITEELTYTAVSIITKIAPLSSTLASGMSVMFALWDGLGRLLDGNVPHPYTVSAVVGVSVMFGLEGASLAAVFNNDRVLVQNRKLSPEQHLPVSSLPGWILALAIAIVAGTESIPSIFRYASGDISLRDMVFSIGLLTLPLLGRAGSMIMSHSMVLNAVDGTDARREERKRKEDEARIAAEERRRKFEVELEAMRSKSASELQIKQAKAMKRLGVVSDIFTDKTTDTTDNYTGDCQYEGTDNVSGNVSVKRKTATQKKQEKFLKLLNDGDKSVEQIARELSLAERTVWRYIADYKSAGMNISVNGVVKIDNHGEE